MGRGHLLLALAVSLVAGESLATEVPATVVYQRGLLTVRCRRAPAREIFSLVGALTASVVLIDDSVGARILTADVVAQPLDRAIVQLLEGSGLGYALAYDPRGVTRIVVGGQSGAPPKADPPPPRAVQAERTVQAEVRPEEVLVGLDAETTSARIKEALSAVEGVERPDEGEAQRAVEAARRVLGKEATGVPGLADIGPSPSRRQPQREEREQTTP